MATINVASASALALAIANAQGGDVIVLAPGDYDNIKIANKTFSAPVTIVSANGADAAHFDRLLVSNVSNLIFKQLDIGGAPVSTDTSPYLADVMSSSNITFDSVHFHGTMDNDPTGDKSGLSIRSSNSVKVLNSEFEQLYRGAWVQRSNNVDVVGNSFHDMRSEGIDLSAVTHVLLDGNKFTNFYRALDMHSDAIQFWTTNETTPSTDIIIRNNEITQGSGTAMQGIFMRDESGVLPYERVLIENNILYESGYANGFTVIGGKSITMTNNTVISKAGDSYTTKIRLENVVGATITGNVTDQFAELGTNSGIIYDKNLILSLSSSSLSLLTDIYGGSTATIKGLILSGYGYQLPVSSTDTATAPIPEPVPTAPTPVIVVPTTTTDTTTTPLPTPAPAPAPTPTTDTSTPTTTTTTTKLISKLSGWGRGGAKKTAAVVEKTAVTSVDSSMTSFTTDGLYTGSYSYSGTTSTTTTSKPLTAASANTTLGGNGFRSRYQLYHA